MKPRCFVTRQLPGDALQRLAEHCAVDIWPEQLPPDRETLLTRVEGATALISMLSDNVDGELMDRAPDLRVIANYAVGFNNIDLDAAAERDILVGNTPDVLTDATADLALALLLAAARRLPEAIENVRAGEWLTWEPTGLLGHAVAGATLGIIGGGRIGQAVARRAEGFDMKVLISGRNGPVEIDQLLAESDFISLHCALSEETHHLIDATALRKMKKSAILINTARGEVVDQDALVEALRTGEIAAAGLDVTDPEPLPADHPLVNLPNAIVLPHIGSATNQAREQMADLCVNNVIAALSGDPMPAQVTASS